MARRRVVTHSRPKVRYRTGSKNSPLRLALWTAWGSKCYWCSKPVEFSYVEIDHILPKSASQAELSKFLHAHGRPPSFDIHDPENLAPICRPCNSPGGKGHTTPLTPIVGSRLDTAKKHRDVVVEHVRRLGRSGKVAAHLLAATANLDDNVRRQEFLDEAPTVVQILAVMDPELVDYDTFHEVEVAVDEEMGSYQSVSVTLNARRRSAVSLLEEVCGTDLADALQAPVVQLIDDISDRVTSGFEAAESEGEPTTAGPPVSDFITLEVDSVDLSRFRGVIEFTFEGVFEGSFSASVVRVSPDGDGTDELQGDAVVRGTFSTVGVWDVAADPASVSPGDCIINEWEQDLHVS